MRILLIEDDIKLCEGAIFHLNNAGYTIDACHDGLDGLDFIGHGAYDLIILDRMLPFLDGLTLLNQIRTQGNHTPVILVTALSALNDKVEGLDAGADDYLSKPFEVKELLARIRALSRRPMHWESQTLITYKDTSLDLSCCVLQGPTRSCSLSKREAGLAEVFLKNPHKILPRHVIFSRVWGPDAPVEDGNLDNYIHFIRRRLHTIGSTLQIKTIRAIGYCLETTYAE